MITDPTGEGEVTMEELQTIDQKLNEMAILTDDVHCAMLSMMADEECRDLIHQVNEEGEIEKYAEYRKMMAMVDGAVALFDAEAEHADKDRMRKCDQCGGTLEHTEDTDFLRFYECEDCGTTHSKRIKHVTKKEVEQREEF